MRLKLRSFCSAAAIAALIAITPNTPAYAQTATESDSAEFEFDIPAMPLSEALREFSIETRIAVAASGDQIADKRSATVRGRYAPRTALEIMLANTGLSARQTSPRSFALAEEAASSAENRMETIVVYGDRSYRPGGGTGTKLDLPFLESPVSVQVVPDVLIRDQQANRIADALKNVAAFQPAYNFGPIQDTFILRGFQLGGDTTAAGYRDGVLLNAYNYATAGIERIEVLKGPASVLYGRSEPGGIVNVVTKKALPEFAANLALQVGSFEFYRALADVGGPIGDDTGLSFRVVGEYLDRETFRDFIFEEQIYGLGALAWEAPGGTTIEVQIEARNLDALDDPGLPVIGDRPARIPPDTFLGEPDIGFQERGDSVVDVDITHPLGDNWSVRGKGSHVESRQDYLDVTLRALDQETGDQDRGFFGSDADYETTYGSLEVLGEFETGSLRHKFLAGVDHYSDSLEEALFFTFLDFSAIQPVNIFDPVLGQSRTPEFSPDDGFLSERSTDWTGLYVQDHIRFGDKLSVLPGIRWDQTRIKGSSLDGPIERDFVSPRFGAVYQLTDNLSIYGQWTQGFGANNGRSATGEAFDPEESEQFEVGIKTEMMGGRLTAQATVYDIVKENILVADISTIDDPFDSIAIGEIQSQGLEVEVLGEISDALSVTLSYAYNDIEITRDTEGNEGNRPLNAPEHSVSAFARYAVGSALTFGGGVFSVSGRQGDNANTFQLPGYTRSDLFAQYRFQLGGSELQAQLNVNNLFDEDFYVAASGFSPQVNPGTSREFRFEVSASF